MWDRLIRPWQICIEEAWAAACAGSIPIGAAIYDANEELVARGHNRIYASSDPSSTLAHHRLAHAEMNALLALEAPIDPRTCVLYTTMEPCPLCLGAISIMPLRAFHYAACDPTAGSASLLQATPFLQSRGIQASGPADPLLEILLVALRVEWRLRTANGQPGKVVTALQTAVPEGVALGTELYRRNTITDLRASRQSAAVMIASLAALQGHSMSA